ncbi:hypothetical protein IC582_017194 [Cucumis melo]|uniref:Uncharacterized protein n=1 Tax=Cucumis melo var. makuwa TaxID=1194695 RepID=A0A5A7TSV2_CUCMM|nr:hypothetical protein E6C27_scaffold46G003960 [Cucumis melo var. makuwa]
MASSFVWKKLLSIVRLIFPSKANAKRLSSTNDNIDGMKKKKFLPRPFDEESSAAPRNGNY